MTRHSRFSLVAVARAIMYRLKSKVVLSSTFVTSGQVRCPKTYRAHDSVWWRWQCKASTKLAAKCDCCDPPLELEQRIVTRRYDFSANGLTVETILAERRLCNASEMDPRAPFLPALDALHI